MIISIVTGTWNRLEMLRAMMESARRQIPRHIPHEFCITDCGSTDGTVEWLREQTDVRLIEQHERRGGIKQFGDAARVAQGDYVIMANDDIEFYSGSILRAVAHLEDNQTCGAVGFADNRSAKMGHAPSNRVEVMPAVGPDGEHAMVNYGQVCMVRRWLGEMVGWWGDRDEIMCNAFTYGGDNYLSAKLWELGYSVDAVDGCLADDKVPLDSTRQVSNERGKNDSLLFYKRFPRGPIIPAALKVPNSQQQRLRILLMDMHEPALPARTAKEKGLADALSNVGLCWEIDYINEEWNLSEAVKTWQPHLLLTQLHGTNHVDADVMKEARAECPSMVVVNWNGDAHERGLINPDMIELLKTVDLQTVVNTAVMPVYKKNGIRAEYWQIGYKDPAEPYDGPVPEWDILFLGNCYNDERNELIRTIQSVKGARVGVYGSCPGSAGITHYDFAFSTALYQHCNIAVSDVYPGTEAFVSNRLFQALAAGAFVLQQHSPRLDEMTGLKAGVHYVEWDDLKDLKRKVRKWAAEGKAEERKQIAEAGKTFVRANFSYAAQVEKLLEML